MKKDILIIDDDITLSELIKDMLENYDYNVNHVISADEAYNILSTNNYHLILLDINLPDQTGFEICKEIRKVSSTPIIFASARVGEDDRITGFDLGADDYISKPYSLKELLARINAIIRRVYGNNSSEKIISFSDVSVNITSRRVFKNNKEISLSLKEFDLLKYLCEHINTSISKDVLISEVWGAFSIVDPSTLTVHIRWLREKLEDNPADPKYIKTVYKIGYMLEVK